MALQDRSIIYTPFEVRHAIEEIRAQIGADSFLKARSLFKFGLSTTVGTSYVTVQEHGGNETYPTANTIDSVISSNAGDDQTVEIEGHTVDGNGDFIFQKQTATLNGQTRVALATPLARSTRVANIGATEIAGTVYVHQADTYTGGVPDTASKVHVIMSATHQQSLKAAITISKNDYWIITSGLIGVAQKSGSPIVTFKIQVREKGGVFRTRATATTSNSQSVPIYFNPPLIVPANSDVRIQAKSSTSNTEVEAWMNGYVAQLRSAA